MGILEGIMIAIGVLFILASFFAPEKLSNKDVEEIARLSEAQLKHIVDNQLRDVNSRIENSIDDVIASTQDKAERLLEKESNEKIMAISEYSNTVLDSIKKTHDEVVFLYSMLNDKYTEMTNYADQMNTWKGEFEIYSKQMIEKLASRCEELQRVEPESVVEPVVAVAEEEENNTVYHRNEILALYREGKSDIEIARSLGLGIGAVRLVVGLYKGEDKNEV